MNEFLKNEKVAAFIEKAGEYVPVMITFLVGLAVIKLLSMTITKLIKKSKIPKTLHSYIISGTRIFLYFILVVILADMLSIPITSLIAAFSVVGLAVSLAIQNSLTNIASGINILITKPFKVGDYIDAAGVSGTVADITLAHCKLVTIDNKDIFVPNTQMMADKIINYSAEKKRRVDLSIDVSYKNDIDKVKDVLNEIIKSNELILKDEDVFVGLTNYKDSSIQYTIRVWTKNADYWTVYLDIQEKLKRAFDANGIEIPYNQMDVHLIK